VVIGHPTFSEYTEEEVAQTLRAYNAHLARIEVITYAELIAGARAALDLAVPEIEAQLRSSTITISESQAPVSVITPVTSAAG
jgi:arginine utilization protein RocB